MNTRLLPLSVFVAVVVALGVLGCDQQPPIEPTPTCTVTLSPASQAFSSDGGTGTVNVATSAASCTWTATPSSAWITVLENPTGTGPGTVKYSVAANAGIDARAGTLTIGGQLHTIGQQGRTPPSCSYDIAPASTSLDSRGGSGTFAVTAPADCPWTATSTAAWLKVTAGAQGSGNGAVSYTVEPNPETFERGAAILVGDEAFAVKQSGREAVACEYSVTPWQFNPCMPMGTVTTTVTTQASCSWTASPNVSWLTVQSGQSGTGPGTIVIAFSANYDAPRDGAVEVRWATPTMGQNVHVSQAGCTYAVSKSAFSFTAAGGSGSFDVLQESVPNTCGGPLQDACIWTAVSDVSWIIITSSMPRAGDNPVSFAVASNNASSSRSGTITVRDQAVHITQAGR